MFRGSDPYSSFVQLSKMLLPLIALALLTLLVPFSGSNDVRDSLPYAQLNVDEIIQEQRISTPFFAGVAANGVEVSLAAGMASPDPVNENKIQAEQMSAQLTLTDGTGVTILANKGWIDGFRRTASLEGGVEIAASDGTQIKTEGVFADLRDGVWESLGPVSAQSPYGSIEAGGIQLRELSGQQGLVFTNGVRMLYLSPNAEGN